jgi:hypothetical protein
LPGVAVDVPPEVVPCQYIVPLEPFAAVREVDPQKDPEDGFTTTAFGNGFTVMVKLLEVAGEPVEHGDAFEVMIQVTASPLFKVDEAKVGEFVPTLDPFTRH